LTNIKSSPTSLIHDIQKANGLEEVIEIRSRLPLFLRSMMDGNAPVQQLNGFVTDIADAVLGKLIQFAIQRLGPPPIPFAFIVMGSACRREETLNADQDNAIVFADVPRDSQQEASAYFLRLGERVCGWLDRAGYAYCKGDFMAQNPEWCQPLSRWKEYYGKWIMGVEPEAQVRFGIFFDFRAAHGDRTLTDELRQHLLELLADSRGFFLHLLEIARRFDSHLGFFGNVSVEKKGEHRNSLDIKSAMEAIVFIVRLYAFLNRIEAVNTVERLDQLLGRKVFGPEEHTDIVQAYEALMKLKLQNQLIAGNENMGLSANFVEPEKLDPQDRLILKESLKAVKRLKRKARSIGIHGGQADKKNKSFSFQYVNLEK
jgi:CBS domain-containing protein